MNADAIERLALEVVQAEPLSEHFDQLHPFTRRLIDAEAARTGDTPATILADAVAAERDRVTSITEANAIVAATRRP